MNDLDELDRLEREATPGPWSYEIDDYMGHIVSPIALTVFFFAVFTPFALVMRIWRRDPLALKADKSAHSYWRPRERTGDLQEQF